MPPPEFFIRLQHGIKGGFAPPTPRAVHTLVRSNEAPSKLSVQSLSADAAAAADRELELEDDHKALLDELQGILKSLPTESPPGSEDIYGEDTQIAFGSKDLEWVNGGPEGCGTGESTIKVSEEQRQQFKRAVEIVQHLASEEGVKKKVDK